jgi:hypothetical protein
MSTKSSQNPHTATAALGLRVKSGRAIAVLVTGSTDSPLVLDRRGIELCDSAIPESRQPYHAGMGKLQTDEALIKRLRGFVTRAAERSVAEMMKAYQAAGYSLRAVGLVVGSEIDPATISNPHIRAHALEGRLFRTSLEEALESYGLQRSVVVERDAYAKAAKVLSLSEQGLKLAVARLGKGLGRPWQSDEKKACLAAWLNLA